MIHYFDISCSRNGIVLQAISLKSDKTHTARDLLYNERIFLNRKNALRTIKGRYSELNSKKGRDEYGQEKTVWHATIHQADLAWFSLPEGWF